MKKLDNWPELGLTKKEWEELVSLEYVLTWGYSDDEERDLKREKELRIKKEPHLYDENQVFISQCR